MYKRLVLGVLLVLFSVCGMVLTSTEGLAQFRGGGYGSRPTYTPPPPPPRAYQPPAPPRQYSTPPASVSPYPGRTPGVMPGIHTGPGVRQAPGTNNPQRGRLGETRQQPNSGSGSGALGTRQNSPREKVMSGTALSTQVVKAPRSPTPSDIQKGFTGKVTADGRALVRLQNQILAVPASRVSGLSAKLAAENQRKTNWTAQQQSAINARVKAVASSKFAVANSAYQTAKEGGKHAGFLRNYAGRSSDEISKGISSIEREIAEHRDKIANPEKYIPSFGQLDPRQQAALINKKWPSDVQRQSEQLDILKGLLNER